MNTKTLTLLTILALAAGTLCAQAGAWSARSGWGARQGHTTVELNGKLFLMGGKAVDGVFMNDVWSSTDGVNWTLETDGAAWSPRSEHASVVYNSRMWVIGGKTPTAVNDVWSSTDGVNWSQETAAAAWSERHEHCVEVFNGEMWLLGGSAPGYGLNGLKDVWTSTDGINWTQQADADWPERQQHFSVVHNGKLYIMGGVSGFLFKTDVWSHDGNAWTLENSVAWTGTFAPRASSTAVSYNGSIYVIGGQSGHGSLAPHHTHGEAWSTTDGITWNAISTNSFLERGMHTAAVFNGRMWIFGGLSRQWNGGIFGQGAPGEEVNDVWSSTDGINWIEETKNGGYDEWDARSGHTSLVFNNKLWLLGGATRDISAWEYTLDCIWSTPDGMTWTEETPGAPWAARHRHTSAVFNGQMWVLGGNDGTSLLGDIWVSPDGTTWNASTTGSKWSARESHATFVFQNKLWVVGGFDGVHRNDVWSSTDGQNWTLEAGAPGWSPRAGHSVTVFQNKLWLMGGTDGDAEFNDVWSSQDGITWTQEVAAAPWRVRHDHTCNLVNGRLWLIGGVTTGYGVKGTRDVWTSTDGVNWVQQPDAPWSGRAWHTTTEFNGEIWVLGGRFHTASYHAKPFPISDAWSFTFAPQITSVPVTTATAGTPYTYTITSDGSPCSLNASGLPAWLSLNGDTLSGTPGGADVGLSAPVTITATNAGGVDQQMFQIDVAGVAPGITSTPVTTATAGVPYSYTFASVGGIPAPVLSAIGLPGWLSFDPNTGVLSGTPGGPDVGLSGTITIVASNGTPPDAAQSFQIDVVGTPAQIVSSPVTSAVAGSSYIYAVTTLGLPAATFTSGPLPGWLSLNPNTGELTGTPPLETTGSVNISITADNGWGTDTQTFALVVLEDAATGDAGNADAGGCAASAGSTVWLALLGMLLGLTLVARRKRTT